MFFLQLPELLFVYMAKNFCIPDWCKGNLRSNQRSELACGTLLCDKLDLKKECY
jgi:hypothetical protein